MPGETNAETIRTEVKAGKFTGIQPLNGGIDDNMIKMDDVANFVTFDGKQARAILMIELLHDAMFDWFNREGIECKNPDRWVTITDKITGEKEQRLIKVDYADNDIAFKTSIKSKQITVDSLSRKQHLHLIANMNPASMAEEESRPNWFQRTFQKR